MNKLRNILLCTFMLISLISENIQKPTIVNNRLYSNQTIISTGYFRFIFSKDESFKYYVDMLIKNDSLIDGCLYCLNFQTNELIQLTNVKPDAIECDVDGVYFLYQNSLFYVDNQGTEIVLKYSGNNIDANNIIFDNNNLYFIDNSILYQLNEETKAIKVIFYTDGITKFSVIDSIALYQEGDKYYYHDFSNNLKKELSEGEIEEYCILEGKMKAEELLDNTSIDPNLNQVKSTFPVGSYYNQIGNASCISDERLTVAQHQSSSYFNYYCNHYASKYQCWAFARKSFDTYSHRTSWSTLTLDTHENILISVSSAEQWVCFLATIECGANVRMRKNNNDRHSFMYIANTSTQMTTYDCNNGNNGCKIMEVTYNLARLSYTLDYQYIVEYSCHNYGTNKIQYNSLFHKVLCTTSGCTGYKLEEHLFTTSGTSSRCMDCGYVRYN